MNLLVTGASGFIGSACARQARSRGHQVVALEGRGRLWTSEQLAQRLEHWRGQGRDLAFLIGLGYRTFMFGDKVCFRRDSIIEALNLLKAVAGEFS